MVVSWLYLVRIGYTLVVSWLYVGHNYLVVCWLQVVIGCTLVIMPENRGLRWSYGKITHKRTRLVVDLVVGSSIFGTIK